MERSHFLPPDRLCVAGGWGGGIGYNKENSAGWKKKCCYCVNKVLIEMSCQVFQGQYFNVAV